jgi:hypothetical protein
MDDFKDFFKDLRDRITSPLFGSFIVSWLLTNWNLVFMVLFNNADTLKQDRYKIIYNAFYQQPTFRLLWFPLIGMSFYIFAYPWIKNYIKLYHAKRQADNDSQILDATRGYSIPLENYIEQLDSFEKEKKTLSGQIAEQIKIRDERNLAVSEATQLKSEKARLEIANSNLGQQLSEANSMSYGAIEGKWVADVTMANGSVVPQTWLFSGSILKVNEARYIMKDFVANANGTRIAFRPDPQIFNGCDVLILIKAGQTWIGDGSGAVRDILLKPVSAH